MPHALIVALSGEICAGKSTLASHLARNFDFHVFKTKEALVALGKERGTDRVSLQDLGQKLDRATAGLWVVKEFQRSFFASIDAGGCYVVDAVRIPDQVTALRKSFGQSVVHIHLVGSERVLFERYAAVYGRQRSAGTIRREYREIKADDTERQVNVLEKSADLVINTDQSLDDDVAIRVASFLGLPSDFHRPQVDVVVGAQFGSEGKGQICAHLAPEYDALVRVGGSNAGHSVYAEPEKHKFRLLPSGSVRAPNAKLIIGPGAIVDVDVLLAEIRKYNIGTNRLTIDGNATIVTAADKLEEKKLKKSIGSTGQGVGAATANNITNRNRGNKNKVRFAKILKGYIGSAHEELESLFRSSGKILLEGTQGTGLSLYHGFYPFVTSRDTTVAGCLAEAGIAPNRLRRVVLVARTYPIRVESPRDGTSGPFESSELSWAEVSRRSGISEGELERCERTTTTDRRRRVAEFNWSLFRRACELNSPTDVALTFVDHLSIQNREARRFEQLTAPTIAMIEEIQRCARVRVSLISTRFDFRPIIDRRSWKGRLND